MKSVSEPNVYSGFNVPSQPPVELMSRPFESMTSVVDVRAISHVFESIIHSSGNSYFCFHRERLWRGCV
eukprot:scaffold8264_cov111-Skeletonema_dohrnii-CCMP3373.AAC.1